MGKPRPHIWSTTTSSAPIIVVATIAVMSTSEGASTDWLLRWPGVAADRVEVHDGRLAYELRGFTAKARWDADDVAAAERAYPGQQVTVSDSGRYLFVGPPGH